MSGISMAVEAREEHGKGPMRRLRAGGFVPGVIYGQGTEAARIKVAEGALSKHLRDIGKSKLVTLESDSKDISGKNVLIREVQQDPLSNALLHVDFQDVQLDQMIRIRVRLEFSGTAVGEKAGGARDVRSYALDLLCRADSIPDVVEVAIDDLEIGDQLRAKDIQLPEGATLVSDEQVTVVAIERRRVAVTPGAEAADAAAAPEEGAEEATEESGDES